jgi:hypothetical protein
MDDDKSPSITKPSAASVNPGCIAENYIKNRVTKTTAMCTQRAIDFSTDREILKLS